MDSNLYALEKQVESRLQDARAAGARAALFSSLRGGNGGVWSSILTVLTTIRTRRRMLRRMSARASGV